MSLKILKLCDYNGDMHYINMANIKNISFFIRSVNFNSDKKHHFHKLYFEKDHRQDYINAVTEFIDKNNLNIPIWEVESITSGNRVLKAI